MDAHDIYRNHDAPCLCVSTRSAYRGTLSAVGFCGRSAPVLVKLLAHFSQINERPLHGESL
jgi:hypothetical protein